jgi:hypothetical protein
MFCKRGSQPLLPAMGAILRSADEHFDEVIVQGIVELALKAPFKLSIVEVARVHIKIISVHRHGWIFELNNYFHAISLGARRKIQQRMLVKAELIENAIQASIDSFGHNAIVKQDSPQIAGLRVLASGLSLLSELVSIHSAALRSDLTSRP